MLLFPTKREWHHTAQQKDRLAKYQMLVKIANHVKD